MTAIPLDSSGDAAVQGRERERPVLPSVPFTMVNADLVTAGDIGATPPCDELVLSGSSARTLAVNSAMHGYRRAFLLGAAIATVGGLVAVAAIRKTAERNAARRERRSGQR
jgi:hypothetical protein